MKGHNILNLWNECKSINNNKKTLNYYDELIDTINLLDDDGLKFRYAKDIGGRVYDDSTFFLNVERIKNDIIKLNRQLK